MNTTTETRVPHVNVAEASRFFDFMAEGEAVTFQTFDDDADRKQPELANILHGDIDECATKLQRLNARGAGVYWMVNYGDGLGRSEPNVTSVRAVFLDLDGAPPQPVLAAGVEPHAVIESSPGKWHIYWLVSGCKLEQFKAVQTALAAKFNGDTSVNDLPRVLRVPGFIHAKRDTKKGLTGEPFRSRIERLEAFQPYDLGKLVQRLQLDLTAKKKERIDSETGEIHDAKPGEHVFAEAVQRLGRKLRSGDGRRAMLKTYIASRSGRGLKADDIKLLIAGIAAGYFDPDDPIDDANIAEVVAHFVGLDAAGGTAAGWPEPTPLPDALPAVPAFDPSLLPEALRGWVSDISDRMQCPPDFPAVGALVSLSSLIGARAVIQPKARDDWRVTPNLWGAIIGRPGVMKSPALGEVLKPLHALEAAEAEAGEVARAQWAIDRKVSELEAERDEKTARKLIGDGKANEARALLAEQEQAAEPVARRFIVNDSSVERLGELLAVNPWGLLAYRDELYGLLRDLDKPQQESARGFYLTGYDGDKPHKFDRIIRGLTHIPRVCLAMLGSIQPSRVQEYVRAAVSGGTGDDGLLQRFGLIVWPDACAEFRNVDRYPDAQAKSRARAVFDRLAALQPESEDTPRLWRFDAAGQEVFTEWRIKHEQMLRGGDLHPALESHLAKYRKLIPALALIFALIDTPEARAVGERELLRALAWGDYLRAHAERLYAAAAQPETGAARALLAKIQAGRLPAAFTPREVAVKGWATLNTPQAVRVAADALADFDWLRREVTHPSVTGGRPSERYVTNPAALQGGT